MERSRRKWGFWKVVSILVLGLMLVGAVAIYLNREWIMDWQRGREFTMAGEMAEMMENLDLTERGEFLFKASQARLSDEEEFNANCRKEDEEIAVLGCYRGKTIYVYKINEAELKGIMETTAAHELLHAVFERMSFSEREELRPVLERVLAENYETLGEDLKNYGEEEQFEELYVRAGTEVAKLPEELEEHYGEIFKNRGKIVKFYEGYNGVFRALKAEMETLEREMEEIRGEVKTKTEAYEAAAEALAGEVEEFNECAAVAGCFTEAEFEARREELVEKQDWLEEEYEAINGLIEAYNEKVEKYNSDVLRGKDLNQMINSVKKDIDKL